MTGFVSAFNYSTSSTPQTRADALLAMLRQAPDAFNEAAALAFIEKGIASRNAADMLTWAALRGRTSIVCALIDKKIIGVNARDELEDTAIINACYAGELATIRALHDRGANPALARENTKCAFYFSEKSRKPGPYQLLTQLYPQAQQAYEDRKRQETALFRTQAGTGALRMASAGIVAM